MGQMRTGGRTAYEGRDELGRVTSYRFPFAGGVGMNCAVVAEKRQDVQHENPKCRGLHCARDRAVSEEERQGVQHENSKYH